MRRNKHNVAYFVVKALVFKRKMKVKKAYCDNCNSNINDEDVCAVVPFLSSAYCLECGERIIIDCKTKGTNDEKLGMVKEFEYTNIFL